MREEAGKYKDQDKERKEQVQGMADSMVYQCEKQLGDLGEKAPEELKNKINDLLSDSKKVLENSDSTLDDLKQAKDKLQKSFEESKEVMKHSGGNPMPESDSADESTKDESSSSSSKKDDDIVDADFEVDDNSDSK